MTGEDALEGGKDGLALRLEGGEVAPQATEDNGAGRAAEAPGHLLLDRDHAQVAFGLVVVERHAPVSHEGQDRLLSAVQPIEEVAGRAVLGSPARLGAGDGLATGWRRVGDGLAAGWRRVGGGLAAGWRRVGGGLAA